MLKILLCETPKEAKGLGRKVFPFDESTWKTHRYRTLYQALSSKFGQFRRLAKLLLETGEKFIVESADYDNIFGISLSEYASPNKRDCKTETEKFDVLPKDWTGQNLLGPERKFLETRSKN